MESKKITVALLGNPNCGKTTLFNALTGAKAKVGNWSGVTVEKATNAVKGLNNVTLVDLPGTYSLSAGSKDRKVVKDFFIKTPPDVVINIVDGLNLERNLYLTAELSTLNIPFVIAINMADVLEKNDMQIDTEFLSSVFGVSVVKISAKNSMNTDLLIKTAIKTTKKPKPLLSFLGKSIKNKYENLSKIAKRTIVKKRTNQENRTQKIDDIITHPFFSVPIFIAVICLVYFVSIKVGGFLGGKIGDLFVIFSNFSKQKLYDLSAPTWIIGLICDALLKGFGSVISFLPQVLVLFSLMGLLEDSGYMARVAFVFDGIFCRLGLSGKSLIPLILSCGCTVTGLSATRTIESEGERKLTAFLSPFMPCSAKSAVFGWLSVTFFNGNALVATSLYFLSMVVCIVSALILKRIKTFSSEGSTFFLEMPTYRLPSIKNVFYSLGEKLKEFLIKAGTVVFAVGIFSWLLSGFGVTGYVGTATEKSFLYAIGSGIKHLFKPLGFGTWQVSIALISGSLAKEAVIETLQIIGMDICALFDNKFSVYAFMAFVTLSPPCIASIATAKKELGSNKLLAFMLFYEVLVAYLVALTINLIGKFITLQNGLLFWLILAIIITLVGVLAVAKLVRKNYACSRNCKKGDGKICKRKRCTI